MFLPSKPSGIILFQLCELMLPRVQSTLAFLLNCDVQVEKYVDEINRAKCGLLSNMAARVSNLCVLR